MARSKSRPPRRRAARWPDLVIAARVVLSFVAIAAYGLPGAAAAWGLVLTIVVIALDAADGYLARRLGVASERGGVLDITGDRIVEHVFWIYFAASGLVPVWIPLVVVTRSFLVDTTRSMALASGHTAFGPGTLQRTRLTRFLVTSRSMRNGYGAAKLAAFVLLGGILVSRATGSPEAPAWLSGAAASAVWVSVALCVARGLPVLWDARDCWLPREDRAEIAG